MSVVTNIMITGLFIDREVVKKQLEKFTKKALPFMWCNECENTVGSKHVEGDVLLGAFNYMNIALFVETVEGLEKLIDADTFRDMQIFIKTQSMNRWEVYPASELGTYCF